MLSDALWGTMLRLLKFRDQVRGRSLQLMTANAITSIDAAGSTDATDSFFTQVDGTASAPTLMMLTAPMPSVHVIHMPANAFSEQAGDHAGRPVAG